VVGNALAQASTHDHPDAHTHASMDAQTYGKVKNTMPLVPSTGQAEAKKFSQNSVMVQLK